MVKHQNLYAAFAIDVVRLITTAADSAMNKPELDRSICWSRDGAVVRALAAKQCVPGSIPGPGGIFGLSNLSLVLFRAPRGFSPDTPVFPSPQKPTFPNSNSIWIIVRLLSLSAWVIAQALPVFDIKYAFACNLVKSREKPRVQGVVGHGFASR